jgi:hypothetical protein
MEDPVPAAAELDEKNSLALAIVPVGKLLPFSFILLIHLIKAD